MPKNKLIGWVIIIAAVILSFVIVLRGTLFEGQPLNVTNFILTVVIAGAAIVGYAIGTSDKNNK